MFFVSKQKHDAALKELETLRDYKERADNYVNKLVLEIEALKESNLLLELKHRAGQNVINNIRSILEPANFNDQQ